VFLNDIAHAVTKAEAAYDQLNFRDATTDGFFALQSARDRYRKGCQHTELPMHRDLLCHYITTLCVVMSPVCPHVAEHFWALLGREGSVLNATWPKATEVDHVLLRAGHYLEQQEAEARRKVDRFKGKKKAASSVTFFATREYPAWQQCVLRYLAEQWDAEKRTFPDNKLMFTQLSEKPECSGAKKMLMPFVAMKCAETVDVGLSALELTVPFDELALLKDNAVYLSKALELPVNVELAANGDAKTQNTCCPGSPVIVANM
jgi:leucyl-tRNA synthetase